MVFQVPDQAGAKVADVGPDLPYIIPDAVQSGDYDWRTPGLTTEAAPILAAADDRPGHDDHQDADGADNLSQP